MHRKPISSKRSQFYHAGMSLFVTWVMAIYDSLMDLAPGRRAGVFPV